MELKLFDDEFSVCKVSGINQIDLNHDFYFIGRTDEELSLVCLTKDVPEQTTHREDHWRAFRIQGVLDFSLIGILSKISTVLAEHKVGIFAVSTFNTDYILVRDTQLPTALDALTGAGYHIIRDGQE